MKKSQELIRNTPLDRQKLKRAGSEKEPVGICSVNTPLQSSVYAA